MINPIAQWLINNNSFENCTPVNQLKLSVQNDKIGCGDIGSKLIVLENDPKLVSFRK